MVDERSYTFCISNNIVNIFTIFATIAIISIRSDKLHWAKRICLPWKEFWSSDIGIFPILSSCLYDILAFLHELFFHNFLSIWMIT